jgi:hypothetical protein
MFSLASDRRQHHNTLRLIRSIDDLEACIRVAHCRFNLLRQLDPESFGQS